jgi:hypothetical protein
MSKKDPPAVETAVTRRLDLDPVDWFRAPWRKPKPLPRPPLTANAERSLETLGRVRTAAEALNLIMGQQAIVLPTAYLEALFACLPPDEFLGVTTDDRVMNTRWDTATHALRWFHHGALPYLPAAAWDKRRPRLRQQLKALTWPTDPYKRPAMAFFLAACAGLRRELLALVQSWPDDAYGRYDWDDYYHQPQLVVFGLGSADLVSAQMRRLRLRLKYPEHARAWLAHTELTGLDYLRDQILTRPNKKDAEQLLEVLCLVKAPDAAPHLLEVKVRSRVPKLAGAWLDEQVGNAVAGLIPVAAARGKLAEAALEYLRDANKKGHGQLIEERLREQPADVAAKVRRDVLEHVEKVYPVLEEKQTPAELRKVIAAEPAARLPDWADPAALPPLLVSERRLGDGPARAVLAALRQSTFEAPRPLVTVLRQHADRGSLDAFAWKLFERWLSEGAPVKEKWAVLALGHLGGDAVALKLTPLVRAWPGEGQHKRAVLGLECLRAIGTDTALMQLNGIAQKLKFQGLKAKAKEFMEAIARDKGLTREELEDRVVPDLDLDDRGGRTLDFGTRQFRVVLGPDLAPLVRDGDGKVKDDLPKPGAKDDTEEARTAIAEWKLLKKQLREVVKVQAPRLEQAMVTGRRWPPDQFETLLVRHPLMTNLAQRLLWAGYDRKGKLRRTFRVTEDQTYADVADRACTLDGLAAVGLVHPLHLAEKERAAWGEVFSEYEILPPFPQLGRPVHTLKPAEAKGVEITTFAGKQVPATALLGTLERLGWTRGVPGDAGFVDDYSKPFPGAGVTAVLTYADGVPLGYTREWADQRLEPVFFLAGIQRGRSWDDRRHALPLRRVDPVAVSEVIADLAALAALAK